MDNKDVNKIESRRTFLRNTGRCGVAVAIGIGMAMFEYKRRRLLREDKCVNRGICVNCEILDVCELPAALKMKDKI